MISYTKHHLRHALIVFCVCSLSLSVLFFQVKMGTPHFWTTIHRYFHLPKLTDRVTPHIHARIKYMMGYPKFTLEDIKKLQREHSSNPNDDDDESYYNPILEIQHYGLGTVRTREDYLKFAEIDLEEQTCGPLNWCSKGELE